MCTSANCLLFLCTSQNSRSLAEHNCAPVKVSSHWLLQFRALVVNYSSWVTCHMHGVATSKGICLLKGNCSLIDIGTVQSVYRVIASFTDAKKFWFIESVWKPRWLTRQRAFPTKKTFSCRLFKEYWRGVFLFPPLWRRNNRELEKKLRSC